MWRKRSDLCWRNGKEMKVGERSTAEEFAVFPGTTGAHKQSSVANCSPSMS